VLPVGVLKLVLHVEEEDAHHPGEVLDGQVDEKKGLEAEAQVDARPEEDQKEVGEGHGVPHRGLVRPVAQGQTVGEQEDVDGPDEEHDEGVAVHPVLEPLPRGGLQVLLQGHGVDVPHAPLVQVAAGGVVPGVGELPVVVGDEGEDACEKPQKIVHPLLGEEGAVPGVVLKDEEAHQEEGRQEVQGQGEEEGGGEGLVGQVEEEEEGQEGVRHLAEASGHVGLGIGLDEGDPVLGFYFFHRHPALLGSAP